MRHSSEISFTRERDGSYAVDPIVVSVTPAIVVGIAFVRLLPGTVQLDPRLPPEARIRGHMAAFDSTD
jgi:hypothetical protein